VAIRNSLQDVEIRNDPNTARRPKEGSIYPPVVLFYGRFILHRLIPHRLLLKHHGLRKVQRCVNLVAKRFFRKSPIH
jgi:hypothetical protein